MHWFKLTLLFCSANDQCLKNALRSNTFLSGAIYRLYFVCYNIFSSYKHFMTIIQVDQQVLLLTLKLSILTTFIFYAGLMPRSFKKYEPI